MTRRLYLAPIVTLTIGNRSPLASKVLEYGRPPNVSSVLSRDKAWAITSADFDDTHHDLVVADPEITYIPAHVLDSTWNDFTVQQRSAIGNRLETLRVPMDWITVNTSVADLLRMATRVALLGQMLKADALDDVSLDSTFGQLPASRRNRILAWATANGVDTTGLTNSTTIRAMLRALVVRYPWNINHELPFMRAGQSQAFSIEAQILKQKLQRGEISIEDLPFSAQASGSDDFSGDLSAWTATYGTWGISAGRMTVTTVGGSDDYNANRYTATVPATNDFYSECDVTAGSGADEGWGPAVRLPAGTGSANVDGYAQVAYGGDAWYLLELTNAGDAVLDTGAAIGNNGSVSNVRITANGTALTGTLNGAADTSATDASFSSGQWGVVYGDFSTTVAGSVDNWDGSDLAAPVGALPPVTPFQRLVSIYTR